MGVPIVLEISSGSSSVLLKLSYRWYTIGDDPWSCPRPFEFGSGSGGWYYTQSQGAEGTQMTYGSVLFRGPTPDSSNGVVLYMRDMRSAVGTGNNPFVAGRSGTAHHNVQGTTIPLGNVGWRVVSVD